MSEKPKRDFIFLDESGDSGKAKLEDSSDFYMTTALHVTDISLREMINQLSRIRYFQGLDKEIKNIHKDDTILSVLMDILEWISNDQDIFVTSAYLEKVNYEGPYLHEDSYGGYDSKKFMKFIIRRTLERHFYTNEQLSPELEIVIDRFLLKKEDELAILGYLKDNYSLPEINYLVQVDSRYSDAIQLVDLIGRIIKAKHLDGWEDLEIYKLNFAEVICLNEIPYDFPEELGKGN